MAADVAPWFVVRPGAERKGKLIKIPLTYFGRETLAGARALVFGEHVLGGSSEGGEHFSSAADLGNLAPGAEFWLMILTDGEPGRVAFTIDLVTGYGNWGKLKVEAPEPVSVPLVTYAPLVTE